MERDTSLRAQRSKSLYWRRAFASAGKEAIYSYRIHLVREHLLQARTQDLGVNLGREVLPRPRPQNMATISSWAPSGAEQAMISARDVGGCNFASFSWQPGKRTIIGGPTNKQTDPDSKQASIAGYS